MDRRFIRSSAVIGGANIAARALGILFSVAVARLYTPAAYGEVRYLMALAAVLVIPTQALPRTLSRFVTKYRALDQEATDRYFSNSLALIAASGLAVLLVTVGVGVVLHRFSVSLLALCVGLAVFALYYDLLRAVERFTAMAVFYIAGNVLQLVIVVAAARVHLYSITLVAVAYGLSCVPPLVVIEVLRRSPLRVRARSLSWSVLRELSAFSLPMLLAHGAYTAWYAGDLLLVDHILGYTAAGNYGLSKTITMVFIFVPYAITTVVLPRFVHAESRNGTAYLRASLLASAGASVVLLALLAVGGQPLLAVAFHHKYAEASVTLLPLSVGMAVYSLYLVLETWVVSIGRPLVHACGMMTMALVTLASDLVLVPMQGQVGAGLGFVLGTTAGFMAIAGGASLTRPSRMARRAQQATARGAAPLVAVSDEPS